MRDCTMLARLALNRNLSMNACKQGVCELTVCSAVRAHYSTLCCPVGLSRNAEWQGAWQLKALHTCTCLRCASCDSILLRRLRSRSAAVFSNTA